MWLDRNIDIDRIQIVDIVSGKFDSLRESIIAH